MYGLIEYKDKDSDYSKVELSPFLNFHYAINKDEKGWYYSRVGLGVEYNKKYAKDKNMCMIYVWDEFIEFIENLRNIYDSRKIRVEKTSYDD